MEVAGHTKFWTRIAWAVAVTAGLVTGIVISGLLQPAISYHVSPNGSLVPGYLTYRCPEHMTTGEHANAEVAIDQELEYALKALSPQKNAQTGSNHISLSPVMEVTLTSGDFDIVANSSPQQRVGDKATNNATKWSWEIAPKRSGTLNLHFAAKLIVDGVATDFAATRDVDVRVGIINATSTFIMAHPEFSLLTVVGGLGSGIWAWIKNKRKPLAGFGAWIKEKKNGKL